MSDWHVISILGPLLLPLILLGLLALLGVVKMAGGRTLLAPVRHGQLAWAGLGFCLNGLYDIRHAEASSFPGSFGDSLYWAHIFVLISLITTAAISSLSDCAGEQCQRSRRILELRSIVISLFLCVVAAVLYSVVHR